MTKKQKTLQSRDFISIGLYSVLFYIINMIVSMVISPLTIPLYPVISGICVFFSAISYLLMAFKVKKRGVIFLLGLITGIIYVFMGVPVLLPFFAIAGILSELVLILLGSNYGKLLHQAIAYGIYGAIYGFGTLFTALVFGKQYFESLNYSPELIQTVFYYANSPLWILITLVITFLLGFSGVYFANILLKKHFIKAGYLVETSDVK